MGKSNPTACKLTCRRWTAFKAQRANLESEHCQLRIWSKDLSNNFVSSNVVPVPAYDLDTNGGTRRLAPILWHLPFVHVTCEASARGDQLLFGHHLQNVALRWPPSTYFSPNVWTIVMSFLLYIRKNNGADGLRKQTPVWEMVNATMQFPKNQMSFVDPVGFI